MLRLNVQNLEGTTEKSLIFLGGHIRFSWFELTIPFQGRDRLISYLACSKFFQSHSSSKIVYVETLLLIPSHKLSKFWYVKDIHCLLFQYVPSITTNTNLLILEYCVISMFFCCLSRDQVKKIPICKVQVDRRGNIKNPNLAIHTDGL